jgi:hypothetical protein
MRIINLIASLGACLALISFGAKVSALCAEALENQSSFAKVCLDREVALITLIDDHAMVEDVRPEKLSAAFAGLLDARALCYAGKTDDAVSAYDAVSRDLGRLHIGRRE